MYSRKRFMTFEQLSELTHPRNKAEFLTIHEMFLKMHQGQYFFICSCAVNLCNQIPGRAPDKRSNCSGGEIREPGSSPETKKMCMMIRLKYKQRFRLPKQVIELMKPGYET